MTVYDAPVDVTPVGRTSEALLLVDRRGTSAGNPIDRTLPELPDRRVDTDTRAVVDRVTLEEIESLTVTLE